MSYSGLAKRRPRPPQGERPMNTTTPPGPLAVAETDAITALLADLMPQAAPRQAPPEEPRPAPEPPPPPVLEEAPVPVVGQPFEGPFPAPIGVVGLSEFLGLVNWRNRPDEARALPLLGVPE